MDSCFGMLVQVLFVVLQVLLQVAKSLLVDVVYDVVVKQLKGHCTGNVGCHMYTRTAREGAWAMCGSGAAECRVSDGGRRSGGEVEEKAVVEVECELLMFVFYTEVPHIHLPRLISSSGLCILKKQVHASRRCPMLGGVN